MKILHVETGRNLYGGALQVFYLLRGLQKKDCTNVLVCPEGSEISDAASSCVDKVHTIPMSGDLDFLFIFRLLKILRQERPDLVHLHSRRGADTLGAIAAKLAGIPVLLTRRVDNPESRGVVAIKYRLYTKIITISEGIKKVLISEGVAPNRIQCIHSAVDTEKYKPAPDRNSLGPDFGFDKNTKLVAVIAQLIARKGHRYLIDAIPDILSKVPEARFVFFGKGPIEPDLRKHCDKQGISTKVCFAGFRDNLDQLLPHLDLIVHPADMEGLGVSLLQAAACGVPIIGTPVGGIPEIVRDGVNGYLVPPGDVEVIASRVIEILGDQSRLSRMGKAGRELVKKEFSISNMIDTNFNVYNQMLS
ncbi:MAG: glycosyltransferase family 4 protein [Gammaproteobacteria bacterium]|nr:MAG: glycosyltransferase family 4 protein [Gammaproteobacteria bacterium]